MNNLLKHFKYNRASVEATIRLYKWVDSNPKKAENINRKTRSLSVRELKRFVRRVLYWGENPEKAMRILLKEIEEAKRNERFSSRMSHSLARSGVFRFKIGSSTALVKKSAENTLVLVLGGSTVKIRFIRTHDFRSHLRRMSETGKLGEDYTVEFITIDGRTYRNQTKMKRLIELMEDAMKLDTSLSIATLVGGK